MDILCLLFFWVSLCFILFTYFGYPCYLLALSFFCTVKVKKKCTESLPKVSIVVSAKNEEGTVVAKLENLIEQQYPHHLMQLIFISDGSADRTVDLLKERYDQYGASSQLPEIFILNLPESKGKPNALNQGIKNASGEIVIFADCRQVFEDTAVRELVANFSDTSIGCVSGELVFLRSAGSSVRKEMGFYWNYEKKIRRLESDSGSVMGATGAIYAVRKKLLPKIPDNILLDDVFVPMCVVCQGMRTIFESQAIAYDTTSKNIEQEWNRKVRTLAGNWQLVGSYGLLSQSLKGKCFFRFFWHKIARLLVPIFGVSVFIANHFIAGFVYNVTLVIAYLFIICSGVAHFYVSSRKIKILNLCYFFTVLNVAVLYGFWRWFKGDLEKIWVKN